MNNRDQIIKFMEEQGPILPIKLARELKTDTLFASAHLSDLSSNKKVKISHIKVGGSPLYYLPGQEEQLQKFVDNLGEKPKRAYELLKDKKVLREKDLEPVMRVAMKDIRDFAVPLEVNYQGQKEIFWKWQLYADQDANEAIKSVLLGDKKKQDDADLAIKQKHDQEKGEAEKKIKEKQQKLDQEKAEQEKKAREEKQKHQEHLNKEKDLEVKQKELTAAREQLEKTKKSYEDKLSNIKTKHQEQLEKLKKKESEENLKQPSIEQDQSTLLETEERPLVHDPYLDQVTKFLEQKKIKIIKQELIKKKTEADLILQVPTELGVTEFYAKAKLKKRINEGDLAAAFLEAKSNNLPALFLSSGELTKKAKIMLEEKCKGMTFVKM